MRKENTSEAKLSSVALLPQTSQERGGEKKGEVAIKRKREREEERKKDRERERERERERKRK